VDVTHKEDLRRAHHVARAASALGSAGLRRAVIGSIGTSLLLDEAGMRPYQPHIAASGKELDMAKASLIASLVFLALLGVLWAVLPHGLQAQAPEAVLRVPASGAAESMSCVSYDGAWAATNKPDAPASRFRHSTVWTGDEMIVWGGQTSYGSNWVNTGSRYDPLLDTWRPVTTTDAPCERYHHSAVWTGDEMIVWGGSGGYLPTDGLQTGGRYDPASDSWTATTTAGAPSKRTDHTAVWTGSEMLVWGGSVYGTWDVLASGGAYDPAVDSWRPITDTGAPSARYGHTAVWTGSEMLIWGGGYYSTTVGYLLTNTGARYNPSTDTWTPITTTGAPGKRIEHTAVWTGSEMLVWGGFSGADELRNGGRYDPAVDTWQSISTTGAPSKREGHTAVWTGDEMWVWGGSSGSDYRTTGGRYDPTGNTWTLMTTTNVPDPREDLCGVWTGQVMVVWGGFRSGVGTFKTGGRYGPFELCASKSALPGAAPGSLVTCTMVISNSGQIDATGAFISDTLPAGLTFAGPVALDPSGAGTGGTPPILVSDATITASTSITATFPVTLNTGLAVGTLITNTAVITSDQVTAPIEVTAVISVANARPQLGTVDPSSGSGPTGATTYFTTTWTDANGWQDLKRCYFHIADSPSIVGNVTLLYNAAKDRLWLRSDDGSTWLGGCAPGTDSTIENSQATLYCKKTREQGAGDTLGVRWAIEFKSGYTGTKKLGLKCDDRSKARAKAEWKGTWTIE
jgi:uncharacterized repeat protein (TIGR01451 family)